MDLTSAGLSSGGKRTVILPGSGDHLRRPEIYLWTPAWQECVCSANEADYNDSLTRRYTPCCQLTFLVDHLSGGEELIGIGRVWLNAKMRPKSKPSKEWVQRVVADCTPPPAGMTTALYRRFDTDRVLLYVGISDDLPARSRWHERHSPWAQFVVARTTDWYATRVEAAAAESAAIKTEKPLFNRQHAHPDQIQAAARYLLQANRIRCVRSEGTSLHALAEVAREQEAQAQK